MPTVDSRPKETVCGNITSNAQSVCTRLRSVLPNYDTLISTLSQKGAWWSSFRQKTDAIASCPAEPLTDFAAQSYTSKDPAELGILTAAYARSMGSGHHHIFALVDSLVTSDFTYVSTLEGLECLILLAKSYTDIGQPRRAWFMWRKGIAIAQLMVRQSLTPKKDISDLAKGFHRERTSTPAGQRIWWTIYHGDRFTSMLLGLPYSFNDAHFGPVTEMLAYTSESMDHRFILQCALCAGKVIDRNIALGSPSFAKAMELDEELDKIAACMPTDWWNVSDESTGMCRGQELDVLRERLLQQYYFFHLKMYIHLPFLARFSTTLSTTVSTLACMQSARQMLARFRLLCAEVADGSCLFECKTSDFVSFMAATVLLIGLSTSNVDSNDPLERSDSLRLVEFVEKKFEKEKSECKLAAQCWKTLQILSQNSHTENCTQLVEVREIIIPYFGVVIRKSVHRMSVQSLLVHPESGSTRMNSCSPSFNKEPAVSAPPATSGCNIGVDENMVDCWGYELPDPNSWNLPGFEYFGSASTLTSSLWLNPTFVDIDQDWDSLAGFGHFTNN